MISSFMEKFKESVISVVPVMLIVMLLSFTIAPLEPGRLPQFLVGGALLIVGLSVFLVGADIGMVPFGQKVGSALTYKRSLPLIALASFAIGFAITIAEPDVQVLAGQVNATMPAIPKQTLLIMIALGVGLFLVIGTARTILRLSLKWLLLFFYGLVFISCAFVEPAFMGIAFDAGGATTGPITVPFIMAMGIGVAAAAKKKEGDDLSFGLVGLASIGPISAVVIMGLMFSQGLTDANGSAQAAAPLGLANFITVLKHTIPEIAVALAPLVIIFLFFQVILLHLPASQIKRIMMGFMYSYLGLVLFMTGVLGGFSPAGLSLGMALGQNTGGTGLILVGLVLGAVVVCAEPAVWVLNAQIEEVSGGYIRRSIMLAALSISIALAVGLGMMRVVTGLSIWWVLLPGYILAIVLTKFCPPLFTAIAFDSGGVASGPMSTTFVLALTLGASTALGGNPTTDAFGMIAMIAMAPLITIQILGLIFKHLEHRQMERDKKRRLS